ncbi:MAG: diphosphate synthase [Candidatus Saccharibacteria bacterium]|nr:diphosphate synthase [Candidatus Saccharibacteria bacterium]
MAEQTSIPQHIGFIVDGNRRWAKARGLPTYEGHRAGYEALKEVAFAALQNGVQYASAYVFSTENWKRSEDEVSKLMGLITYAFKMDLQSFIDNNVQLRIIGSRERLSDKVNKIIDQAEEKTAGMTGGVFVLCLNYGGQAEIADACKKIVQSGVDVDQITPELIAQNLYAPDVPPIDIVVRTSGEQRLSNFMLWRSAYSELMFIEKFWPDMTKDDVTGILEEYSRRSRRFGG